ncbi:MAG: hypothetical protein M1829_002227 [Trizodia sp. TS-e1964]|nr:MAG: hypothetical protein M1829_002227 [Trizodia sp. TS-e1964]
MSVSFVQTAASGEAEIWRMLFLYPSISELTRDILDKLSYKWNPELAVMLERILQMQAIYLEQSQAAQAHQSPEIVDRSARLSHREVLQIVEKFASNMVQYQSNNNDAALDREAQFRVLATALSILPLLGVTNLTHDLYRDLRKQLVLRNDEVLKGLRISKGQMSGFSNAGLLIRWSLDSLCDTPSDLNRNITIFQGIVSIILGAGLAYNINIPEALACFEVFRELPDRPSSWHKILVQLHRISLGAIALARHSRFAPQDSERLNQYSCQVAAVLLEFVLTRFCNEFERLRRAPQLQQKTMASIGALTTMLGNEPPVNEFHGAFGLLYVAGNLAAEFGHLECFVKSKHTWVNAIRASMDKGNFRMLRLKLFEVLLRIKQAGFDANEIAESAVLDNSDLFIKKEQNIASFIQEAQESSDRFAHARFIETASLLDSIKLLQDHRGTLHISQMNYGLFAPQSIKPAKFLPVKPKQSWLHHGFLAARANKLLKPQSGKGQSKPPDRKGKSPDLSSLPPRALLPAPLHPPAQGDPGREEDQNLQNWRFTDDAVVASPKSYESSIQNIPTSPLSSRSPNARRKPSQSSSSSNEATLHKYKEEPSGLRIIAVQTTNSPQIKFTKRPKDSSVASGVALSPNCHFAAFRYRTFVDVYRISNGLNNEGSLGLIMRVATEGAAVFIAAVLSDTNLVVLKKGEIQVYQYYPTESHNITTPFVNASERIDENNRPTCLAISSDSKWIAMGQQVGQAKRSQMSTHETPQLTSSVQLYSSALLPEKLLEFPEKQSIEFPKTLELSSHGSTVICGRFMSCCAWIKTTSGWQTIPLPNKKPVNAADPKGITSVKLLKSWTLNQAQFSSGRHYYMTTSILSNIPVDTSVIISPLIQKEQLKANFPVTGHFHRCAASSDGQLAAFLSHSGEIKIALITPPNVGSGLALKHYPHVPSKAQVKGETEHHHSGQIGIRKGESTYTVTAIDRHGNLSISEVITSSPMPQLPPVSAMPAELAARSPTSAYAYSPETSQSSRPSRNTSGASQGQFPQNGEPFTNFLGIFPS